jgi:60 kDa SS-A/Ro ribonucleoprotein
MVKNNAGGYGFPVDDWARLDRFLILGAESGTYYIGKANLAIQNAQAVQRCVQSDGIRTVNRVVEISTSGRAPKNDPALFSLAVACIYGDDPTRRAAWESLHRVARIGTHLFQFVDEYRTIGKTKGSNRLFRQGVSNWYNLKSPDRLAYQVLKYQQRNGWSHRDVLRLAHVKPATPQHNAIYHWAVKGWEDIGDAPHPDESLRQIWAYERAKRATSESEIAGLVKDYRLTREMVPTQWQKSPLVWEALMEEMPITAMVRNLGRMGSIGLLKPMSKMNGEVISRLRDTERLSRSRVHPIQILAALLTYAQGHGHRGKLSWIPVPQVVDALDEAFYATFDNVESTGKRICLGLDVSGSMRGTLVNGIPFLSCRKACGAMALVFAKREPNYVPIAFDTRGYYLSLSSRQRVDDVMDELSRTGGGGTNCAIPILGAIKNKLEVDLFVTFTDGESWYGKPHPIQALWEYRRVMGIQAKLVSVAMASNGVTITDFEDGGCLDTVGFDTAVPQLISDFA